MDTLNDTEEADLKHPKKKGQVIQVIRQQDQFVISHLIADLIDHRIYFYQHMCIVIMNKVWLLNQIEYTIDDVLKNQ